MKRKFLIYITLSIIFCVAPVFSQNDSKNDKNIVFSILLDNTGSMRSQIDDVKNIGKVIVRETDDKGVISLLNFKTKGSGEKAISQVVVGVERGLDKETFINYIDNIEAVGGQTKLLDSILSAAKIMNSDIANAQKDVFSEKVLILVTDGEDRTSETKEKELIKYLKQNNIKVYVVGLIEELSSESGFVNSSPQTKAKDFLKKITKESGGKVAFPNPKQKIQEVIKKLLLLENN